MVELVPHCMRHVEFGGYCEKNTGYGDIRHGKFKSDVRVKVLCHLMKMATLLMIAPTMTVARKAPSRVSQFQIAHVRMKRIAELVISSEFLIQVRQSDPRRTFRSDNSDDGYHCGEHKYP